MVPVSVEVHMEIIRAWQDIQGYYAEFVTQAIINHPEIVFHAQVED